MRKVSEKPAELKTKITAPEGFDHFINMRDGKLTKRHSAFAIPARSVETDRKGYKKFELSTGQTAYFRMSTIPDALTGKRIQRTIIIEDQTLKYVAFHEGNSSRLMFTCAEALQAVREIMPAEVQSRLDWAEWQSYRSPQKSLRVRNYTHDKFKSEHAKKINDLATERKAAEAPKAKKEKTPKAKKSVKKETAA